MLLYVVLFFALAVNYAVTKRLVSTSIRKIMTKVSDSIGRQNARLDKIEQAVTGITGDVTQLKDLVRQLQSTQGEITPEDQALLDQIEARTEALSQRLEALDAENPEAAPAPENPPANTGG